jgi:hypothetical protein
LFMRLHHLMKLWCQDKLGLIVINNDAKITCMFISIPPLLIMHLLAQLRKEGRRNEYERHKLQAINQRQKMVSSSNIIN